MEERYKIGDVVSIEGYTYDIIGVEFIPTVTHPTKSQVLTAGRRQGKTLAATMQTVLNSMVYEEVKMWKLKCRAVIPHYITMSDDELMEYELKATKLGELL